jgi:membrane-bound lytic murein transglycosylase D
MVLRYTTLLVILLNCVVLGAQTFEEIQPDTAEMLATAEIPNFNPAEVKSRLPSLGIMIKPEYTPAVEGFIKTYVLRNREKTEKMLGRTTMYFALFEKLLKENALPIDLKYLAVIESALNPKANSRAGAGGLWQFMPSTAMGYGLKIDEWVDERSDPNRSTKAAIAYLKDLHRRYDDWALAIASYNSGPGRVNRAIKLARSKNFWRLSKYLPKETRSYVPGFIAAAYVLNNFQHHDLKPLMPELDVQLTESVLVYQSFSFFTIAQITGLGLDLIRELNPSYLQDFIPENIQGNYLNLPKRVMSAIQDFLHLENPDAKQQSILESTPVYVSLPSTEKADLYYKSYYTASDGERLEELSEFFNIPAHCLKIWNKLRSSRLDHGQEIVLYQPREYKRFKLPVEEIAPIPRSEVPANIPTPLSRLSSSKNDETPMLQSESAKTSFWYVLQPGETLLEVSRKFPGNSVESLKKLNSLSARSLPTSGQKIKVVRPHSN